MSAFTGPQFRGAMRQHKAFLRTEAEARNAAYRIRLARAEARIQEVMESNSDDPDFDRFSAIAAIESETIEQETADK